MDEFIVYNTHMEIVPYERGDLPSLEAMYTAVDKFTRSEFPCGYIIEEGRIFIPRGTPIPKVEMWSGLTARYVDQSDPVKTMSREHHSYFEPRDDLQKDSIEFLTTNPNHQLALNLDVGKGKTFCVAYSATELGLRTLIITPSDGLKMQWIKTFTSMFDYKKKELINIAGSDVMEAIEGGDYPEADVYFVNHQTLRSYLSNHGPVKFHDFFKALGAGIKVYDESHLEFMNIIMIDSFSNTDRTWYLTATFDRSDRTESACFKRAFYSVSAFGEAESAAATKKHIIYHVVDIRSRPEPMALRKVMARGNMTAATYGNYAFNVDPNETAYNSIKIILEKIKDVEGKVLVFVPLIEVVDKVAAKLRKDFPEKSIGVYHSKVSADEKESALKKDIIISTIKSCGTGRDIPGLRAVICLEPIASKVQTHQMIGRLRPYAPDKSTYFFDVVDRSIPAMTWWANSRLKKAQSLVKEVVYLDITK